MDNVFQFANFATLGKPPSDPKYSFVQSDIRDKVWVWIEITAKANISQDEKLGLLSWLLDALRSVDEKILPNDLWRSYQIAGGIISAVQKRLKNLGVFAAG